MFRDRREAGEQLAAMLRKLDITADLVLAVPRGGLPVADVVARTLGVPLDVVVAQKMGAPGNPELAVGAVAADGTTWVNAALVRTLGLGDAQVDAIRAGARDRAREKERRYRGTRPEVPLGGKRVLVVDDGVATGATTLAALRSVRARGAVHVVLAVPVGSRESLQRLEAEADAVVCIEVPWDLGAVGQAYRRFDQVSDAEALGYLRPGGRPASGP